jgi:hypothetical protein
MLKSVAVLSRVAATILTPVVVIGVMFVLLSPPGASRWVAFPTLMALMVSIPLGSLGIVMGDMFAPQRGLSRLVVFTLGGAIMGAAVWALLMAVMTFFDLRGISFFGALPGGAAGFVAALWKPWATRNPQPNRVDQLGHNFR